jgi:dTDP-4-amino-4,6-dideoxygalactose transaminase
VNDREFEKRAEIIWEKGTNRAAFYRGEIDKYGWVDVGSSFLPADTVAAFLFTQIVRFEKIQSRRKNVWWNYHKFLKPFEEKGYLKCPVIPDFATVNGNIFYITLHSAETRDELMKFLKANGISAIFHYLPLHSSPYFAGKHDGRELPNTDRFSSTILRLPFYNSLRKNQVNHIASMIGEFFGSVRLSDNQFPDNPGIIRNH